MNHTVDDFQIYDKGIPYGLFVPPRLHNYCLSSGVRRRAGDAIAGVLRAQYFEGVEALPGQPAVNANQLSLDAAILTLTEADAIVLPA